MSAFATTKLSSKGQVVIPEEIRLDLSLEEGTQFVVIGQGDTVILRMIRPQSLEDLKPLLARAKDYAKKVNLKKSDLKKAISKARKSK